MDDVEMLARAIWRNSEATRKAIVGFRGNIYRPQSEDDGWPLFAGDAQAALDALTTAGYRKVGPDEVVVPREPTRKALQGLYDWLREPDHAATFSLRDLEDWLHSRPSPVALRTLVDTLQTQENGDG